jgi:hypothetical protein
MCTPLLTLGLNPFEWEALPCKWKNMNISVLGELVNLPGGCA